MDRPQRSSGLGGEGLDVRAQERPQCPRVADARHDGSRGGDDLLRAWRLEGWGRALAVGLAAGLLLTSSWVLVWVLRRNKNASAPALNDSARGSCGQRPDPGHPRVALDRRIARGPRESWGASRSTGTNLRNHSRAKRYRRFWTLTLSVRQQLVQDRALLEEWHDLSDRFTVQVMHRMGLRLIRHVHSSASEDGEGGRAHGAASAVGDLQG
jgi:hypothetical protein